MESLAMPVPMAKMALQLDLAPDQQEIAQHVDQLLLDQPALLAPKVRKDHSATQVPMVLASMELNQVHPVPRVHPALEERMDKKARPANLAKSKKDQASMVQQANPAHQVPQDHQDRLVLLEKTMEAEVNQADPAMPAIQDQLANRAVKAHQVPKDPRAVVEGAINVHNHVLLQDIRTTREFFLRKTFEMSPMSILTCVAKCAISFLNFLIFMQYSRPLSWCNF